MIDADGRLYPGYDEDFLAYIGIGKDEMLANLRIDTTAEGRWDSLRHSDAVRMHTEAQRALFGTGPPPDPRTAVELLGRAAELGLPHAQVSLGWLLLHGLKGAARDPEMALAWNSEGARQGHPEGANNLGFNWSKGSAASPIIKPRLAGICMRPAGDAGKRGPAQNASPRNVRTPPRNEILTFAPRQLRTHGITAPEAERQLG